MALREFRGAGLRRALGSRAVAVALAAALYLGAGAWATWPALKESRSAFLAEGLPSRGGVAPGDHLQSAYNLWLPGHQVGRGEAPWLDPYSFQPVTDERVNFAAWPFALVFWPLHALLGTVVAWNAFVLLSYLGAGALTFLWLRELDFRAGAALAGGVAFALAPYLVAQGAAGHLLAPVSMLLPLALFAWERGRLVLAAVALASVPLAGQVHLALGAIPFFFLYAWLRPREQRKRLGAAGAVLTSVAAGLLVYAFSIRGSVGAGGRSFEQVERYSAELADFVAREPRHGLESFVFLGWGTPLLALAGVWFLVGAGRGRLAFALGLGALVPSLLALGGNLPGYEQLWSVLPGLHETRVPERLLPIACLSLAALVAAAVSETRRALVAALVVAFLFVDLRVDRYRPSAADEGNRAYAALRAQPSGRVLELPVFLPDRQEGSVYLYYAMQAPRERPTGYATTARPEADSAARGLQPLNCGDPTPADVRVLEPLDVRYIVMHAPLYRADCIFPAAGFPYRLLAVDEGVFLFDRRG